jgi:hypothetical protein
MRLGPVICAALVVAGVYRWYSTRDIERAPGVLVAEDPEQQDIGDANGIDRDGFRLVPRAEFSATVRVLRREDYSLGPLANIEISQGNRFYYWRTENWPIDRREIEIHSANWHVIPENASVRDALARLRAGSVVELRGRLVDIEGKEGGMRTSLTREDTGAGACEILLASSARVMDAG